MASVITVAGEKLFALKAQTNEKLDIDTFIFANIPGQDPTAAIDRTEGMPAGNLIAHQQTVQQAGRINDNVVVYSTVLSSTTGPFEFNWVGLYSSVNNTLVAINHVPTVAKTVSSPGVAGNTLNRNFGIEYSGVAELTGITVAPETWQLDFTSRLSGMDELTRQLAADMNGTDWFIGDGFKVAPRLTLNTFSISQGVGYVSGQRAELLAEHILTVDSYPQHVFVDVHFTGNSNSQWKPQVNFTVINGEMDDYVDVTGIQHFVFKLAVLNSATDVTDLRSKNSQLKTDVLSDVFGNAPVELVAGLVITPINNQYPKLAAFNAIYELADNSVIYTVKSFSKSVGGDCVITLDNDQLLIAKKVSTATKAWTQAVTQLISKDITTEIPDKQKRLLDLNVTYESERIKPTGHYILDGQYSTIRLKDGVQLPVFYDHTNGGVLFECKRLKIDANMHGNHEVNHSSGVFWLTGWERVRIFDVDVVNAYRNIVNLYSCRNVVLSNYSVKNCGLQGTAFGGFTYGATFEAGTYGIDVSNFEMKDCHGFGIHIYKSGDAHLRNIDMQRLTCDGVAIGITLTEATKVKIENFTAVGIDGTCLEINASQDIEITNFNLSSIKKRALLFGDNGRGINNKRIKLSNGQIQTLEHPTCCAINHIESAEFDNVYFYKPIDVLPEDNARAKDILFTNCKFFFPITENLAINPRFKFVMCDFEDIQITNADEVRTVFSSVDGIKRLRKGEYIDIPFTGLRNITRGVIADVKAVASYSNSPENQTGILEIRVKFDMDNSGGIVITEQNREGTQYPKYLTASVATDVNNEKVIRLTNKNAEVINGSFSGVIY